MTELDPYVEIAVADAMGPPKLVVHVSNADAVLRMWLGRRTIRRHKAKIADHAQTLRRAMKNTKMSFTRISTFFFALGLAAATMGLVTYSLGIWLTSDGNYTPAGGISMIFGIFCTLAAGLLALLSLVARICEH